MLWLSVQMTSPFSLYSPVCATETGWWPLEATGHLGRSVRSPAGWRVASGGCWSVLFGSVACGSCGSLWKAHNWDLKNTDRGDVAAEAVCVCLMTWPHVCVFAESVCRVKSGARWLFFKGSAVCLCQLVHFGYLSGENEKKQEAAPSALR